MYIQQGYKTKNQWWRYLATIVIWFTAQTIGSIPLMIYMFSDAIKSDNLENFSATANPADLGLGQNFGLILMLLPLVLSFFGLAVAMKYIHQQPLKNVFTSAKKFRWRNFFIAFSIWGVLLVVLEMISYLINPDNYYFNFNISSFIPLLIIAVVMIPFQAGAEELLFRGNLMQGIGVLTRSRIVPLIVTSAIFGLMHITNPEVKEFGLGISMVYYISFGLFMGVVLIMDGGLEMPLAIHTVNNIFGSVFVGYSGSVLQTPAMFKIYNYDIGTMLILFFGAVIFYFLIAKQLFKWKSFSHMFKPLDPNL